MIPGPDDLRRLHWLREDLASCLGEIGTILRRASGEFGIAPVAHVAIETVPPTGETSAPPASGDGDPASMQPPTSITWVWVDGTSLVYDWRSDAVRAADAGPVS